MNNCARRLIALAIVASSSGACAPTASSPCPPLVNYTAEQSQMLAEEIERMTPDMVTPDIVADYLVLRGQVRTCRQVWP